MSDFYASSGVLAKVPGELIAQGSLTFPRPDAGQPAEMHAEVDHPYLGRVRITYQLASNRHHKSVNWYWKATFAEVVGAQ
jgi:hypothetical protein